jgi:hypothetical protein
MKAQTILALLFIILIVNACNKIYNNPKVVYNCDMASFHPDYPKEVKQKCRELLNENSTSK